MSRTTVITNPAPTPCRDRGTRAGAAITALVAAVLLAGCGTEPPAVTTSVPRGSVLASEVPGITSEQPAMPEPASGTPAVVGRASAKLAVYDVPDDPAPARILPAKTDFGTPTVVLVSEVGTGATDG
jgi:hypothetical protein